jgi:hypothetical protein
MSVPANTNPTGNPTFKINGEDDRTSSSVAHVDEPAGEFSRFEDLASKLVQVPKDEIDEQREKA